MIWFDDLSEPLQADILILKRKLETGLGKNSRKTEHDGVFRIGETGKTSRKELRIYYGQPKGENHILYGGFKNTKKEQNKDIQKAKKIFRVIQDG